MLEIECPNGHKLRVPPDYAGHPGRCTQCSRRFVIGGDPLEEVPESAFKNAPGQRFPAESRPNRWHRPNFSKLLGLLSVIGGSVGLLGLMIAVLLSIPRSRSAPKPTTLVTKTGQWQQFDPNQSYSEEQKFLESKRRAAEIANAIFRYQRENKVVLYPVMPGSKGNYPYSWRVAILPFLKQQKLQQQYHFDEPWNSPHNQSLVSQCPTVFRSPFAPPESTNSGYFLLDGPGAFFEFDGAPPKQIPPWEALMLVEARRDVPWTKPDEIEINRTVPCKEFGGFVLDRFTFTTFDLKTDIGTIRPDKLSALYVKGGNQVVNLKLFGDPRPSEHPKIRPDPLKPSIIESDHDRKVAEEKRLRELQNEQQRKSAQMKQAREQQRIAREQEQRRQFELQQQKANEQARLVQEAKEKERKLQEAIRLQPLRDRIAEISLKRVARGLIAYQSVHGHFPPAVLTNPETKTTYSWRVAILPFLDQEELYKQYRKDQPWDSPENQKLLQQIPVEYQSFPAVGSTNTHCLALIEPGRLFQNGAETRLTELEGAGGLTRPMLLSAASRIPWTKPEDLVIGEKWELPVPESGDGQVHLSTPLGVVSRVDQSAFVSSGGKRIYQNSFQADSIWMGRGDGQISKSNIGRLQISPNVELLSSELLNKAYARPSFRSLLGSQLFQRQTNGPTAKSFSRLILIQAAMNRYAAEHGRFPSAVLREKEGGPLRSWRVELLPYLGEQLLYDKYRKDEPWDSPENLTVLQEMPAIYRNPLENSDCPYSLIVGPGCAFEGTEGKTIEDIKDGIGSTMFVVETRHDVPWTKPEDIQFNPERKESPDLPGLYNDCIRFTTGDMSVHSVDSRVPPQVLRKLILCNDGSDDQFENLGYPLLTLSLGDAYLQLRKTSAQPAVTSAPQASSVAAHKEISADKENSVVGNGTKSSESAETDPAGVQKLTPESLKEEVARVSELLKKSISSLEEGDITTFYESCAPEAELDAMRNRGILKSERVPFLPKEAQQWLSTLKGFQEITPNVDLDGTTAEFSLAPVVESNSSEEEAPAKRPQIEAQAGAGFGDEIQVVLASAIAALEARDQAGFVEKIYPAGELLRLELDGQKKSLLERLQKENKLVQQMVSDLRECQKTIPSYSADRSVVTFEVEVLEPLDHNLLASRMYWIYGPPPSKVFKFQMSGGSWRFYDHTLEQLREIQRQSSLDLPFDSDDSPKIRFKKVNDQWRLEPPSEE